ncbi:MAG: cellulase family glycosylhydrolase [Sedimentisphaerales bacterium]|nr:cellulase family glycosylhydrolase [Sedimentisphaerales bacterium]
MRKGVFQTRSIRGQRRIRMIIAVLLAAVWVGQVSEGAGFLRTREHDMVDEDGNVVLLRGVGLGNWFLPEGYMWKFGDRGDRPRKIETLVREMVGEKAGERFWREFRRNYITEADIRRISELGFNSVRPALNARLFLTEGENAVYVSEGFDLLDNLVKWCKKYGVYVIIDMHGAPGGQTGTNIDDSPHDEVGLFTEPRNQERLIDLWVKIADLYKNEPAVAAYDLLNEPLPQRTGAAEKYKAELEPLYRRITKAIRTVDKRHMITVEGADWANDWSVFTKRFDDNMFYQFHYYCWDRPTKLKGIASYISRRETLNAPVWVGETGEKDNAIYWGTTQYFEANNIGWSFWPWKKMDANNGPCSVKRPAGWDEIAAFSRGQAKPSAELAQKALDELVENVKLENCVFHQDVVNAIFRRAPGVVEAENYGHEGAGKSYFVKDAERKSELYRTSEPVPVESTAGGGGRRSRSGQCIRLEAGEWTAYTIHSLTAKEYRLSARIRAVNAPAELQVSIGGQEAKASAGGEDWQEADLGSMKLAEGANSFKVAVKSGVLLCDRLRFSED